MCVAKSSILSWCKRIAHLYVADHLTPGAKRGFPVVTVWHVVNQRANTMPNGGCCRKYSYSQKGASLIARKLDENLCLKFATSPFSCFPSSSSAGNNWGENHYRPISDWHQTLNKHKKVQMTHIVSKSLPLRLSWGWLIGDSVCAWFDASDVIEIAFIYTLILFGGVWPDI